MSRIINEDNINVTTQYPKERKIPIKEIILVTKNKDKKIIELNNIRIQNRAGRGTNIMVINLDDEIAEVQYS